VRDIRHWSNPEYTRVVIDLDQATLFYSNILEDRSGAGKPPRIYIDLFDSIVEGRLCKPVSVDDGILLGIRAGQYTPDSVRIVLDIDALRTYRVFPMQNPFRIVVDVTGGTPPPGSELATLAPDGAPTALPAASETTFSLPTPAPIAPDAVPELAPLPPLPGSERPAPSSTAPAASPPIAAAPGAEPQKPAPAPEPPRSTQPPRAPAAPRPSSPAAAKPVKNAPAPSRPAAPPPADGKLSLARQLGLGIRRVVIDAGHGAHDPGAPGVGGLQEKEVTLDVALRLREILQSSGYDTILTRDRDVYLPLEERTALANTSRGDLFISVHCNASDAGNLSGIETYFLNLASTRRAMATAARENSMALANMSDLQDLLKEIYTSKMDESSRFADAVQRSLHAALRRKYPDIKDLGVKQAPFYVLIGAQMPSVLAEISFINHKKEGRRLADPLYRQLIAEALAEGVKRYAKTVKTAALTPAAVAER
jgi:N-acetylmuramoyl-L-alanine amidase